MANLELAKNYQKKLWESSGRTWKEEDFNDKWIYRPFGTDWDVWNRNGLLQNEFCPLCGSHDMNLTTPYKNNSSITNANVFLCNSCLTIQMKYVGQTSKAGTVTEEAQTPQKWKSYRLQNWLLFLAVIFIFKSFVNPGFKNIYPIIVVCSATWISGWYTSINQRNRFMFLAPMGIMRHRETFEKMILALIPAFITAIISAFFISKTTGFTTLVAGVITFFLYATYWEQIQLRRGY